MRNKKIVIWIVGILLTLYIRAIGQNKPNIILIMADDLGFEALPMYGNDSNETPNLQQLADQGMLFENCHSTPLCTPSRVQLMTGKYNFRNYVGFGILDPEETTFGHWMQEAGYTTCIVGKWQLFGNQRQQTLAGGRKGALPGESGFDYFRLWQVQDRGSRYKNPLLETSDTGLEMHEGKYGPDLFVDYLEQFMEDHVSGPFFVYYPMVLTHDPFEPTPEENEYSSYHPDQKKNDPKHFPAMVKYMDHLIGKIVRKTENLGIAKNTLIIFIGDNGTDRKVISSVNGKEIRGNKGYTTNFSTHVPMIAYWPGRIRPGSVYRGLVDFTDFVPTLLEVAGENVDHVQKGLDGVSLLSVLTGNPESGTGRTWVFCHYDPRWGNFEKRRFIHDTRWKVYDNGEIYDWEKDLEELHPLTLDDVASDQRPTIKTLRDVLDRMQ